MKEKDESGKFDYVGRYLGWFSTNELYEYDPGTNTFSPVFTSGAIPTPQLGFGIAILDDRVFVHGGRCDRTPLGDFAVLDMRTLVWTKIDDFGFSTGLWLHTLTPISSSQLLLVGGEGSGTHASNRVKIFDADLNQWKDEDSLPDEFCANDGGLWGHSAIGVPKENGVAVICVGGTFGFFEKFPNHILMFDVTY